MSTESKPDMPYNPLSTATLSALLETNGQLGMDELQVSLEAETGIRQPIDSFVMSALVKHGLAELDDGKLSATEAGVDYISQRTTCIDHPPKRLPRFTPTKYLILSYLQDEAGYDGWLFGSGQTSSIFEDLSAGLGMSCDALTRRLADYQTSQLIEKQAAHTQNGRGNASVTNIRLTQQGEAELEEMRIHSSEKITELMEASMDDQIRPGEEAQEYLPEALATVTEEINNMLVELGEEPRDFARFNNLSEEEMREALGRFRAVAEKLERRIDQSSSRQPVTA